ncbi:MAG: NAD(P)/FAD-dependent oxidoreductase [Mycobacteriaceae bacterium]|nr:NAD(P)/FAD-dependent oxidoreductase [Mycobacteriaceae bacterium]
MTASWECVVVGAGAAGLSAALVLGRARRRTLVIDAGEQSNLVAPGVGGLLGHDGQTPAELYALGRRELSAYPTVELRAGQVVAGAPVDDVFELTLADGGSVRTMRVLLATGMDYCAPELPGVSTLWGKSVFHCPFCHGWELRDRPMAALASGEKGLHAALLLRGWTDDVVLLTDGPPNLGADDLDRLATAKVTIDERRVIEVLARDGELDAVVFADGTRLARDGLLVPAPLRQRSDLAEQLGAVCTDPGPVAVNSLAVDALGRTTMPTVFAAGDACTQMPQVAGAIAAGSQAATMLVQSLLGEEFGLPFPPKGSD